MKTIIAGSRWIDNKEFVFSRLIISAGLWTITEVVCGCAKGVDTLGKEWAQSKQIPVKDFPADWSIGRAAGPIRNGQMAEYAEALIAIKGPDSRGTEDMIIKSKKKNFPHSIWTIDKNYNVLDHDVW
jgi:hypothetical protein